MEGEAPADPFVRLQEVAAPPGLEDVVVDVAVVGQRQSQHVFQGRSPAAGRVVEDVVVEVGVMGLAGELDDLLTVVLADVVAND
ncbi:MAG: hypothetical protein GTO22_17915, partial [Gemmatimonadales bacterium]|nr:hypothetical protein [Gemmatimonadales bacterium]